jgi:hypothetical protein
LIAGIAHEIKNPLNNRWVHTDGDCAPHRARGTLVQSGMPATPILPAFNLSRRFVRRKGNQSLG